MIGSFKDGNRSRTFLLGAGLLGLILIVSLAYSQIAYDTHSQARTRTRTLQTRLDDFSTVRGKVNAVVEALTDRNLHFANPSLAIDQRVWNLQTAWNDFRDDAQHPRSGARFLTPSPSALDVAMDQFALAALRNSVALRRGNTNAQTALQLTASIEPQLTAMEQQIADSIRSSAAERDSALVGIGVGRSVAYGAFFGLAALLAAGLLVSGMRSFKEWIGRTPVARIRPDRLASPQR